VTIATPVPLMIRLCGLIRPSGVLLASAPNRVGFPQSVPTSVRRRAVGGEAVWASLSLLDRFLLIVTPMLTATDHGVSVGHRGLHSPVHAILQERSCADRQRQLQSTSHCTTSTTIAPGTCETVSPQSAHLNPMTFIDRFPPSTGHSARAGSPLGRTRVTVRLALGPASGHTLTT